MPLPPVIFGHLSKPSCFHQLAQAERGIHDGIPVDAFAGIEIDHDAVGMFEVLDGRIPRMHLDRADLDQPEESIQVVDPQPHSFAAFALLNAQLVHGGRNVLRQRPLVIEGRAVHVPHQLERAMPEMRQRFLPDLAPIVGEFFFRRHNRVGQKLQDVLSRNAQLRPAATEAPAAAP